MNALQRLFLVLFAFVMSFLAGPSFATDPAIPDVTGLVTTVSGTLVPIGLVGIAVLAVIVGIKVFQWVRKAL